MQESVIDFPKAGLCQEIWEKVVDDTGLGDMWKMRQEVKDKLVAIVQDLQTAQLLPVNDLVIHVTGSITSNQYTENADIDLHFHSDSLQLNSNEEVDKLNKDLRASYKQEFIGKHPIEIYYQDNKFQDYMSVGCYDVTNDIWEVGPEIADSSFNPYAEYYDEAKKQSEAIASQIRNKILSIYETAIALKKNLGTEFGQNLRGVLLEQLASVQALYDSIRKTRKVYSSPTSKEEALRFRTSRKWHIADTAFKLFDKYGYLAILKSFIQIFDIMSSSELTDIEACDNIVKVVRDYIGNADKLMDSEFYESVKQVDEASHDKVKIWVDDVRPTPSGYMTIQSVDEFIEWFDKNGSDKIEVLDLDHDAGKFHSKGGDYIRILDYLEIQGVDDLRVRIHSDNPVGRQNMQRIIKKNGWKEDYDLMADAEQVDEGAKDVISVGLLATLLAIPGILPAKTAQKAISSNQKYEMIVKDINNNVRMIGDYTAFQATNIIARTLYAEARNDGEKGMRAVASVIYNRADGKINDFVNVCKKNGYSKKYKKIVYQFSCWGKMTNSEWSPKNFKVKIPNSVKGNAKNETLWKVAKQIAADMLAGNFTPITNANMYYNDKKANPDWGNQLTSVKYIGSHKFGILKNHSPFI